jgi:hypothetical protein
MVSCDAPSEVSLEQFGRYACRFRLSNEKVGWRPNRNRGAHARFGSFTTKPSRSKIHRCLLCPESHRSRHSPINATCQKRTSLATIAASGICLIPIHSPTISVQPIEKVHALSLMGKRAHSDVDIHGSPDQRARRPNGNGLMGTLMGTLWARAEGPSARLLNPFKEMARPEGFEPPTPRFVVWCRV